MITHYFSKKHVTSIFAASLLLSCNAPIYSADLAAPKIVLTEDPAPWGNPLLLIGAAFCVSGIGYCIWQDQEAKNDNRRDITYFEEEIRRVLQELPEKEFRKLIKKKDVLIATAQGVLLNQSNSNNSKVEWAKQLLSQHEHLGDENYYVLIAKTHNGFYTRPKLFCRDATQPATYIDMKDFYNSYACNLLPDPCKKVICEGEPSHIYDGIKNKSDDSNKYRYFILLPFKPTTESAQ